MTSLLLFVYLKNRNKMHEYPKGVPEPVSIIVPCYNDEKGIGKTIESLLSLDYPKNMIEIIVVDDKSSDNSAAVAEKYARKYSNVRVIVNKRNSGRAAEPTNIGIRAAKYNYIAVADADSTPDRDALIKMIGFLQADKNTGAVTCAVLAKNPKTYMQKLQAIEYDIIAWTRKLLDFIDSVYVTPGPFALYKKKVLMEVGLFDTKNMTQDIEIVWRLLSHDYKARMCLATRVYSETPETIKGWFRQRIRWQIGGNQTIWKYKSLIFKKGMLGAFILPFFALSLFLGLFGLGLFAYLTARGLLVRYLSTKYSLYANSAILHLSELTFTPSILNFFGIVLFIIGIAFTMFGLAALKSDRGQKHKILNIIVYSIIYLTLSPITIIFALYRIARRKYSW
ncbi:MAG: glycosyltransferase [Candidatus Pacearchaeota archaeon]